jgi:hypothetical protein
VRSGHPLGAPDHKQLRAPVADLAQLMDEQIRELS